MHLGIRTKFILLVGLLLLTIFGAITAIQIRSRTEALRAVLLEESRAFASLATQPIGNVFSVYKDSGTLKIKQQIDQFATLNHSITNVAVVDVGGKVVYSQQDPSDIAISPEDASTFEPIFRNDDSGALSSIIYPYFEASGAHRYSIIYYVSDQEIERSVRQEAIQLLYFGIFSLVSTMGLLYLLMNRFIIKPVSKVSEQASIISSGNLEQQIEVHGTDEIASLGQSVNKMAESLKASIAQLKEVDRIKNEFMMITSHNLRTPLTIISGYLDNMSIVMGNPAELMEALKRIGASVRRLEVFAEDVLTISRFELGNTEVTTETVKVSDFIGHVADEFRPTAELKNITFKAAIENPATQLNISTPYIRSAIWNVLDNAAKFTPKGGEISLLSADEGDNITIRISDTGIGISKDELSKLFTKFHRGTSTLRYDYEGTGIGLYASKMMIEKHGGTITAESTEGKGSVFTISLPTLRPQKLL